MVEALADQLVDPLAQRLLDLLKDQGILATDRRPAAEWIDATEMARRLGVTRTWVYEHAVELGAVRIGEGPRPRLRFPPNQIGSASSKPSAAQAREKNRRPEPKRARGLIPVYDG